MDLPQIILLIVIVVVSVILIIIGIQIIGLLKDALPATLSDRESIAANLVPSALAEILGPKDQSWTTERRGAKKTLFIKRGG